MRPSNTRCTVRSSRWSHYIAVCAVMVGLMAWLAGCGGGNVQVTATGGVGGRVGDIVVRDAKFAFDGPIAGDTVYQPGDNAALQLTIINEGNRADRLVRVSSPIAGSATITGNTRIPGHQTLTAGYPAPVASATSPGTDTARIVLARLRVPIRVGSSYPVVFTFEEAGELRLGLPVANPDASRD